MATTRGRQWGLTAWLLLLACACAQGCLTCKSCGDNRFCSEVCNGDMPRELRKTTLPPYVIEPPDILVIDAVRVVPLPPYRIEALDALAIVVAEAKPAEPINIIFVVTPEGRLDLGFSYGSVAVVDMTLEEATKAIENALKRTLKEPKVSVSLAQSRGRQQIRGEHLVHQDGTVNLGVYGQVPVAGLTLPEAKAAIEAALEKYLVRPEIALDVGAFNSKVYYVITDGGGYGKQIYRLPIVGSETVLDALAQINGLPSVSAYNCMWIARPAPDEVCRNQILPVDLASITERGSTATNYQLMPGDRVYVKADGLITLDNYLAKIINPIQRLFGAVLLGEQTVQSFKNNGSGSGF
jgi:polysaccharide biosynthesis/export protein